METQDLVVIGGGTSGYIVATGALRFGLKVALLEKQQRLGGSALHFGCIPSKTLLHVAQVAHTVQHASQYGLESALMPPNLSKVNKHINKVITKLEQAEDQEAQYLFKQLGGQILFGAAKFLDPHTVQVGNKKIRAKKFVIATGASAVLPEIRGLDAVGYFTPADAFSQSKVPEKLIIIGGKTVAIEFAQAFKRLGSKVTVVAQEDSILPQEDPELVNKLKDLLIQEGIDFYLNSTITECYFHRDQKFLEGVHDSGSKFVLNGTDIMVALGTKPNIAGLGLENAGVKFTAEGILVDKKMRTSRRYIYALGDVARNSYKFTHAAEYQANIVLSNVVYRYPARVKYNGFPYAIFTTPEYAQVGITELQAERLGYKNIRITRFEFKDLDSAAIQNVQTGMIKVITKRGKIIGVAILGPQASNLIAEWGLAINMGANINHVAATIHAYPTLAQINRRVASKHSNRNLFSVFNRKCVNLLQKVFA
jgi:pyruvate/2-oxoglutarate dehydrogenase complex dihydrolipoamide dehydrogenase (E3) component